MKPEVVENRELLLGICAAGRGYIYNDTEWCLHLPQCGIIKRMKPEPTPPSYNFVEGEPYPSGRNRGATAFFDGSYDEVKDWLDKWRPGWWTCGRPECFGSTLHSGAKP